jgi:hypothetical protein
MANVNSKPVTQRELKQYDRARQLALKLALELNSERVARAALRDVQQMDRKMDRRLIAQGFTPPTHLEA